jgi:hypothetical protein
MVGLAEQELPADDTESLIQQYIVERVRPPISFYVDHLRQQQHEANAAAINNAAINNATCHGRRNLGTSMCIGDILKRLHSGKLSSGVC